MHRQEEQFVNRDPAAEEPRLLPPSKLAILTGGGLGVVAAGLMAALMIFPEAGGDQSPSGSASSSPAPTIIVPADRISGAFQQLQRPFQENPGSVLAQLELLPDEKEQLQRKLRDNSVRLALVRLWDTQDEDGDEVDLISAGYSQRIRIRHKEQIFFLPIEPGGVVRIRAARDGRGGVTLGIATAYGRLPLPTLAVGQVLELPAL